MKLCVFEDEKHEDFYPMALTRPVYCLKFGMEDLCHRISRRLGLQLEAAMARDYLGRTTSKALGVQVNSRPEGDDGWLFVNGRVSDPSAIGIEGPDEAGIQGSDVVYVRASSDAIQETWAPDAATFLNAFLEKHEHRKVEVPMINHAWDLVLGNSEALTGDFEFLGRSGLEGEMADGSYIVGEQEKVYLAPSSAIDPLVVLDTTHGPIYIDEGARVFPHTRVEGPCYVGKSTQLVGGKIREGCSIGPVCRVGGEVEESIFHGHSNKYHDGFIGHSYIGEWVNLGALTTNSDLKNDYSGVQIFVGGRLVDTGSPKVGSFIGDHVKTGIGSLLNTGTVVGPMSILMPSGEVFPKNIPSFCLLIKNQIRGGLGFDKLVETARTVMSRRGVELTHDQVQVLSRVYEMTAEERETLIRRDRRKRGRSK